MTDTCAACGGIDRVTGILRCRCGVEVCSECRVKHEGCSPQPCPTCGRGNSVWVLRFDNYEPAEVCGVYATREDAEAALNEFNPHAPWSVEEWELT